MSDDLGTNPGSIVDGCIGRLFVGGVPTLLCQASMQAGRRACTTSDQDSSTGQGRAGWSHQRRNALQCDAMRCGAVRCGPAPETQFHLAEIESRIEVNLTGDHAWHACE